MKSGRKEERKEREERDKRARGGKVEEDSRTRAEVSKEEEGHKRGGKVEGKEPRHRPDRRARGGRMTPKSPFSGADTGRPAYASTVHGNDVGGKGKEPRP